MFKKFLTTLLVLSFLCIWMAFNFPKLKLIYYDQLFQAKICKRPITYRLAKLDNSFGLSQNEAEKILVDSEKVWEKPVNQNLFDLVSSTSTADIDVSFIYDERQKSTDSLKNITGSISSKQTTVSLAKSTFNSQKQEYDNLVASYKTSLANYQAKQAELESKKMLYARGGYSQDEVTDINNKVAELEKDRASLESQLTTIRNLESSLKSNVSDVNLKVDALNNDISLYNSEIANNSEAFREGEFISDGKGRRIYVYEFQDITLLKRLFAHELGHALGMGHVDGENSILYMYNKGTSLNPSKQDLEEFQNVCDTPKTLFQSILLYFI